MKKTLEISLLVDSNRGIYIPQLFCTELLKGTFGTFTGAAYDDIKYLSCISNMQADDYLDIWAEVSDNIVLTDLDGDKYTIYPNGDLWAVPEGMELPDGF